MFPNFILWKNPLEDELSFEAEKLLLENNHIILNSAQNKEWFINYTNFIIIGRDMDAYGIDYYPTNNVLLVICYKFPIEEKDLNVLKVYWKCFFSRQQYYFPRWAGLLEHFVKPPPVELSTLIQ